MEKSYTVAQILFSRQVQGRSGPQYNIRFTTNQTGETNVSGFFPSELKTGQEIVGEIVQKPGLNKNNQPVTYHNFHMAKRVQVSNGASPEQWMALTRTLTAIQTELKMIRGLLEPGGVPTANDAAIDNTGNDDFESFEPFAPEPIAPEDLPTF